MSWFPNLSNCNTWTWCSDFVVNVILRFQIDGSDRGSNFYETKFMDSSRLKENREIWSSVYGKRQTLDPRWNFRFLELGNEQV